MNDKNRHNDTFEDFYKSAFNDAEMEIPADLTNSLMEKINPPKAPTKLSDKIGASKLYRLLQASLLLNLVTVSVVAYYLTNTPSSIIRIETPVKEIIIKQQKESVEPIVPVKEKQNKETSQQPTINKSPKTPKSKVQQPQTINVDAVQTAPKQDSIAITSPPTTSKQNENIEPEKQTAPQDLDDLRKVLQDSTKGKSLFDKK